tara:strand:+ start:400 stop:555 length:156 start_codon:yes stop_codon:yes gene_type:complete
VEQVEQVVVFHQLLAHQMDKIVDHFITFQVVVEVELILPVHLELLQELLVV